MRPGRLGDGGDSLYRDLHEQVDTLRVKCQELSDLATADLEQAGIDLAGALEKEIRAGEEIRQRLVPAFTESEAWQETVAMLRSLARVTAEFGESLQGLLKSLRKLPDDAAEATRSLGTDLTGISLRLQLMAQNLLAFTADDPQFCAWFEITRGRIGRSEGIITRLCTAPLVVAPLLRETLLERMQTVVLTSATLTVAERFDYLRQRTGLNQLEPARVAELLLTSPFDFKRQALLAELIETDPGAVLHVAMPERVRQQMPLEVQAFIERMRHYGISELVRTGRIAMVRSGERGSQQETCCECHDPDGFAACGPAVGSR